MKDAPLQTPSTPPLPRTPRCLVNELDGPEIALDRAVRHHLQRVLRLRDGAEIELVDGSGGLARAHFSATGRATIVETLPRTPASVAGVHLAVAAPRPTRLDWLVEKAAELDVSGVHLLRTQFTVRDVGDARVQRLQRKADEALIQCRRLHRLEVAAPRSVAAVLERMSGAEVWLAAPPTAAEETPAPSVPARRPGAPLLVLVGPEGGFAPEEQQTILASGARPVRIGSTVLRVETAALALVVAATLAGEAERGPRPGCG